LQSIVSFIGLFAKETYNFKEPTNRSHPILPALQIKPPEKKPPPVGGVSYDQRERASERTKRKSKEKSK